jgi:hypothetical protein
MWSTCACSLSGPARLPCDTRQPGSTPSNRQVGPPPSFSTRTTKVRLASVEREFCALAVEATRAS